MDKLIVSLVAFHAASFVSCQYDQGPGGYQRTQPPSNILLHKQALGQDGSFNYAFAADNGLRQGEIINPDGSRKGSYSYVDPNGKTVTLSYTAGKDGFRVLNGDHLPKPPEPQQQRPNPQYYQQPPPQNQHYSQPPPPPQPHQPPNYPLFRPNPIPFDAYRNAPNAPAYRGAPPPAPYQLPYAPPPQAPHRPPPHHQPHYSVQEADRDAAPRYLAPQTPGDYPHDDPRKPHSFGNGYSFEFAG